MRRATKVLLSIGFAVVMAAGAAAYFTQAKAAACRCPLIYAPVQCDHGKVYPNQCVADCHHAKNCVPTGQL